VTICVQRVLRTGTGRADRRRHRGGARRDAGAGRVGHDREHTAAVRVL